MIPNAALLRFPWLPLVAGVLLLAGSFTGCQQANAPLSYEVRGRVVERAGTHGLTIAHDTIPGFMPPMTMAFIARDSAEVAAVSVGDSVQFRWVLGEVAWIEAVEVVE